jgi:mRNA interferase RelE/StbE
VATYNIQWKPSALHEIKRLDRTVIARIVAAIEILAQDPFPTGVRKLQGSLKTYRMRVGDYRVIYEVFAERLIILVVRVRHRKEAYR